MHHHTDRPAPIVSLQDLANEPPPSDRDRLELELGPEGGSFKGYVPPEQPNSDEAPQGDVWADFWRLTGLKSDQYRIVDDTVRVSMWQQSKRLENGDRDTVWLRSYRGSFQRVTPLDLAADDIDRLLTVARQHPTAIPANPQEATRVVVASDAQVGKRDKRGGTPELLARIGGLLDQLGHVMAARPCADALILDPGDIVEGFENTAQQRHTNDLSLPAQLRVARGILTDIVSKVAAQHEAVTVATCPSNHGAWRSGKDRLGRPGDDFGIDVHLSVADVLARDPRFGHVTWHNAADDDQWTSTVALEARGHRIALTHGDHARGPDKMLDWWAGQHFGGQPAANAHILHTGHFHTTRIQQAGILDGKPRWWMQAPTMDNGSAWWGDLTGADDTPGILTYVLTENGPEDIRVITATP